MKKSCNIPTLKFGVLTAVVTIRPFQLLVMFAATHVDPSLHDDDGCSRQAGDFQH
jgi:hypothetical protein